MCDKKRFERFSVKYFEHQRNHTWLSILHIAQKKTSFLYIHLIFFSEFVDFFKIKKNPITIQTYDELNRMIEGGEDKFVQNTQMIVSIAQQFSILVFFFLFFADLHWRLLLFHFVSFLCTSFSMPVENLSIASKHLGKAAFFLWRCTWLANCAQVYKLQPGDYCLK